MVPTLSRHPFRANELAETCPNSIQSEPSYPLPLPFLFPHFPFPPSRQLLFFFFLNLRAGLYLAKDMIQFERLTLPVMDTIIFGHGKYRSVFVRMDERPAVALKHAVALKLVCVYVCGLFLLLYLCLSLSLSLSTLNPLISFSNEERVAPLQR